MKAFGELIMALDATTKTNDKVDSMVAFLNASTDADKLWFVALLSGKRPKRPVKTSFLREWAAEVSGIPLWLLEESYHVVGDLAETVALILPQQTTTSSKTLDERMHDLLKLKEMEEAQVKAYILSAWAEMNKTELFVFNKLITGGFRIGVSQKLIVRALAKHLSEEENLIAHRLMGNWQPQNTSFEQLLVVPDEKENLSRPYPFYLAYPLEAEPQSLGKVEEWQIEYKWDGIRGQLIFRDGEIFVWSRGEELVTERFPELEKLKELLPTDCVIDGEIMGYKDGFPLTFNHLQTRIGRKKVSKKIMEDSPVVLIAYDLLEKDGQDLRETSLEERRKLLEEIAKEAAADTLLISEKIEPKTWEAAAELRSTSREVLAEGLMLKRKNSTYKVGRKRGDWYKWKVDPMSIDAVMIYAMRGHGRRANLYSDYTFAVWKGEELVPFAKAYSGLTDKEMQSVDQFVKRNTIERFGPVRSVKPELVFEIGFEGIAPSTRHKSGIALRFPRILRRRLDKKPEEANTLEDLKGILESYNR